MPRSCSQSAHSGPRASRMSTARACGAVRLGAPLGDAVVADHRRREADELLGVARVGDRLLVAGHRGREDGLAERDARRAATDSPRKTVPSSRSEEAAHAVPRSRRAERCDASRGRQDRVVRLRPASRGEHDPPVGDRQPHLAAQRLAEQPRVGRARAEAVLASRATRGRGRAGRGSRGAPTAIRGSSSPKRARRAGRHPLEQRLEREQPGLDELRVERRRTRSRAR